MKWKICVKKDAGSAMDAAFDFLPAPDQAVAVLVKEQTSGRGRQGSRWVSPLGGLYCSILLRPDWAVQDISKMTLLAAVAVCEAVRDLTGLDARIKWPNDLLIDGQKLAGILTESKISGQTIEYVVVGIGVNVNTEMSALPDGAVSLQHLTGRDYDLKQFLDRILERFGFWYENAGQNGFETMFARWRDLCGIFGQRVRIQQAGKDLEGIAQDLAEDGNLLLRADDGSISKVVSGDILF